MLGKTVGFGPIAIHGGQIEPMNEMFRGLAIGLGMAVLAIFLLLTAYFQSIRLAFAVMATAPAVVAGVAIALLTTFSVIWRWSPTMLPR